MATSQPSRILRKLTGPKSDSTFYRITKTSVSKENPDMAHLIQDSGTFTLVRNGTTKPFMSSMEV